MAQTHIDHNHTEDVIGITDVVKRIPEIATKLPTIAKGLVLANDRRSKKNMGLGWAFAGTVRKNPTGVAVKYEDYQLTYSQLNEWANQLAHFLLSKHIKKGDVVVVYIENRPELLCAAIACAKVGAIAALVNTSQTGKVLTHSINLVEPKLAIVGDELLDNLDEVLADTQLAKTDVFWWADTHTLVDSGNAPKGYSNLAEHISTYQRDNPACSREVYYKDGLFYIYTSGTTGLPKAVVFTHGRWMKAYGTYGHIMNLKPHDVMYVTLPLYHATGMVICWASVIAGQSAIALRRKFSSSNFWKDIHKFNATSFGYVGELCRYLLDNKPTMAEQNNPVVKMIGNGLRPNIWHEFKARFGIDEVLEFYASSEGNIGFSNVFNFENTVGFSPLPYDIVQYDKEKGEPVRDKKGHMIKVGVGEVGLLLGKITPRSPFDGYTDPEKNKAVIFENVFKQGDKYFNTGDLMRNIGLLHAQFVDRVGDTFRWKGENVSTTEVENILADHPSIHEAIVYGVEINGTNGRAGMAAITAAAGYELDKTSLTDLFLSLKEELPTYAIPVFLRIQQQVETTGTFKYSKTKLKATGFDPSKTDDPIWVCLPGESHYQLVDSKIFENIQTGTYRF